jgi:hypothetical protein
MQRSEWGAPVNLCKPLATRRAPLEELSGYPIAGALVNSIPSPTDRPKIDYAKTRQGFGHREILGEI